MNSYEYTTEDGQAGAFSENINKINPVPNPNALSITAMVKKSGRVVGYQLSDGQKVSRADGVRMAKQSQIKGVAIAEKQGTEYLRSLPDGTEGNNLSSLPTVTME